MTVTRIGHQSVDLVLPHGPNVTGSYAVEMDGNSVAPAVLDVADNTVRAHFNGASILDTVQLHGELLMVARTWTVKRAGLLRFPSRFAFAFDDPELLVPSVLYRGNKLGSGAFPRGGIDRRWQFMEDRTPIPGAVLVHNDRSSVAFCLAPTTSARFYASVATMHDDGLVVITADLPGQERPLSYRGKHLVVPGRETDPLEVAGNQLPFVFTRTFVFRATNRRRGSIFHLYTDFVADLAGVWQDSGSHSPLPAWSVYFTRKLGHLRNLVEESEKHGGAYVRMGRGNGDHQPTYNFTAGSFLVRSLEAAWILVASDNGSADGLHACALGERIGRFFLNGEISPGMHQDNYDLQRGVWGGYLGIAENEGYDSMVNARCNGESMRAYVRLYDELRRRGVTVPEFIGLPIRVADFYLDHQLPDSEDGSFGRWWRPDGTAANTAGTNGAYVASFLVSVEPYYPDRERLSRALERAAGYYSRLARAGDFFGDTLDADSYDRESGVAILSMFLDLYERDGARESLDVAVTAAEYVLSWIWQYDVVFDPSSPLGTRGFMTTGMSAVSVAHHHLDFYGPAIAYEFLRLHEHTGIGAFEKNAVRMLDASRQLLAGENGDFLGRDESFAGWQPEQINHTHWDYFDRLDCGKGSFDICIAWPAVLGLRAYLDIRRRFPDRVMDTQSLT